MVIGREYPSWDPPTGRSPFGIIAANLNEDYFVVRSDSEQIYFGHKADAGSVHEFLAWLFKHWDFKYREIKVD